MDNLNKPLEGRLLMKTSQIVRAPAAVERRNNKKLKTGRGVRE
jgi:hypothetical protein